MKDECIGRCYSSWKYGIPNGSLRVWFLPSQVDFRTWQTSVGATPFLKHDAYFMILLPKNKRWKMFHGYLSKFQKWPAVWTPTTGLAFQTNSRRKHMRQIFYFVHVPSLVRASFRSTSIIDILVVEKYRRWQRCANPRNQVLPFTYPHEFAESYFITIY